MITFENYPEKDLGKEETIKKWLKKVAKSNDASIKRLSYNFVDNESLLAINKEHLNHDYYTDIITFEYGSNQKIEGEIFISLDQVQEQAVLYNTTYQQELLRVVAHGLLHLLGFDDGTDDEKVEMRSEEEKSLILHAQIIGN